MTNQLKTRLAQLGRGEVPEGYQRTKVGVVPEEWEVLEIQEITAELKSGLSRLLNEYDIGVPVLRSNNIKENSIDFTELKYWYLVDPQGATVSGYFLKDNDIIINFINSLAQIGKTAIYKNTIQRDVIYTTNLLKFVPNNKMNVEFYFYFTLSERYRTEITAISKPAVNQASFTTVDFKRIKIQCPSLPEQQKIATILATQDKLIKLKEQLIAEKQQQKKYLMQQLLTGKKRLDGFDGEWNQYRLEDLGYTYGGLTGKTKDDFGSGKPYIPYMNIFANPIVDTSFMDYVVVGEREKQTKVKYGDVFFTTSSETANEVGMSSVLLNDDNMGEIYLNSFCFGLRLYHFDTLAPHYATWYFRSQIFRCMLNVLAQGVTRFNLSKVNLLKCKIKIPALPEQTAIANILTTADREIELLQQELEQEKQKKKALMQLLLTGIVRVTV